MACTMVFNISSRNKFFTDRCSGHSFSKQLFIHFHGRHRSDVSPLSHCCRFQFQFTQRINRTDLQMMTNSSLSSSFVVALTHEVASNHTGVFDRFSKQLPIGNEHRYQNISKILNNSRETTSNCMCLFSLVLTIEKYISVSYLAECSLFPSIVEIVTCLPTPSMSTYPS
jgi:hypothetical protein